MIQIKWGKKYGVSQNTKLLSDLWIGQKQKDLEVPWSLHQSQSYKTTTTHAEINGQQPNKWNKGLGFVRKNKVWLTSTSVASFRALSYWFLRPRFLAAPCWLPPSTRAHLERVVGPSLSWDWSSTISHSDCNPMNLTLLTFSGIFPFRFILNNVAKQWVLD
jgi:hypothetical protein